MISLPYRIRSVWNTIKFTQLPRIPCSLPIFLLIVGIANTVLFHRPLIRLSSTNLDLGEVGGWLTLSTVLVLQVTLTVSALAMAAAISIRLAKLLAMLMFGGNAIALYFVDAYGVIFDKTMMGNAFNTNVPEALGLFHPKLLLYIALFALVPSVLLAQTTIREISRIRRLAFFISIILFGSAWIYADAKSWLWIDKHAKQLGSLLLPWSYTVNSVRHVVEESRSSREVVLLPSASFTDTGKALVVLVIGESARAANFSLYGYARMTNPQLGSSGVLTLPDAQACATYTTLALRCILSHLGEKASPYDTYEPLPNYLQRNGVEVVWRTNNFGQPPLKVAKFQDSGALKAQCHDACERLAYDEVLLHDLERSIKSSVALKKLVVLHQAGSHGPQYFNKYPPEFEVFKPACKSVDQRKCSREELVNAYDNTIVYTDYFLGRLISILKTVSDSRVVMLYVSDHGESLGEYGLYLHGTPLSLAPAYQKNIPFIVWMSESFMREKGNTPASLRWRGSGAHGLVFHSVLGALGINSEIYNGNLDLFVPVLAGGDRRP